VTLAIDHLTPATLISQSVVIGSTPLASTRIR
jgi:hypothetical protein